MTPTPHRVWQRLLPITVTACLVLGTGSASVHAASGAASPAPSPVAPAASPAAPTGPASPSPAASVAPSLAPVPTPLPTPTDARLTANDPRLAGFQAILDDLDTNYNAIEADRQLLLELRKTLPDGRSDAEAYLSRLEKLATVADADHLGQPAQRVAETASTYLDWRDGTYASQAEQDAAFLSSGAAGFSTAFDALKDAILLDAANRFDTLLSLRDRLQ